MIPWTRAAVLLALVVGCARPEVAVPVVCAAVDPPDERTTIVGRGDPLELLVQFDSVPARPGGVRLRVDGLAEPGLVVFGTPTPTAAAAGMTLTAPARYYGCAAAAAFGLELRAPFPPRGKAWVRVSSDRPVRMRVRVGPRTTSPRLTAPGASAIADWEDLE